MRSLSLFTAALCAFALSGCIARTAADIVTAPVKVVAKGADLATTSQSEADEKRGRELRKREEELGKLERRYDKQMEECRDGSSQACDAARSTYADIERILPTLPAEPETN